MACNSAGQPGDPHRLVAGPQALSGRHRRWRVSALDHGSDSTSAAARLRNSPGASADLNSMAPNYRRAGRSRSESARSATPRPVSREVCEPGGAPGVRRCGERPSRGRADRTDPRTSTSDGQGSDRPAPLRRAPDPAQALQAAAAPSIDSPLGTGGRQADESPGAAPAAPPPGPLSFVGAAAGIVLALMLATGHLEALVAWLVR